MIQWNAKQIQNNGNFSIVWTVKDTEKQLGINGSTELPEEYTGTDLVEHLKEILGEGLVTSFEQEAVEIYDTIPGQV